MSVTFDFDTAKRKAQLVSPYIAEIRELFSVENKVQTFMKKRFGCANIPCRKYAFTNKGYFDLPFYTTLAEEIRLNFPQFSIHQTEEFKKRSIISSISTEYTSLNLEPRDYQHESTIAGLNKGKGVIVLPTSAGKTLVIGLLTNTSVEKGHRVLILVPNIQLVQQTFKDFCDYGIDQELFSRWTGDYPYQNTKVVIANNQILLSKKQDISVLQQFSVIIVDECHAMASAEKITKVIKQLNGPHIFGFTGSLPEDKFDVWSLNRVFGDIIYHKKSVELRKDQYISKVQVAALQLSYKNIPHFTRPSYVNPTAGYEEEITWLQTNSFRTDVIAKVCKAVDNNTLVLVDRIAHGEFLQQELDNRLQGNKKVFFIQGSVEVEEREKIRALMENETSVVCIAISRIFSTGISIKNLHNVIFAAIGKARIKIIQSIGRSLRLHKSKRIATIFDIADVNLLYGLKHFRERKRLYETEKIPLKLTQLVES